MIMAMTVPRSASRSSHAVSDARMPASKRVGAAQRGPDPVAHLGHLAVVHGQQQLVGVVEVAVAERLADPGPGGDALHGDGLGAALGQQLDGDVEQLRAPVAGSADEPPSGARGRSPRRATLLVARR